MSILLTKYIVRDNTCINDIKMIDKKIILMVVMDDNAIGGYYDGG